MNRQKIMFMNLKEFIMLLRAASVNVGDVTIEAHLGAYMRPFIEVSQGYLSSFIMEIEGQEEAITVTQENFDEQMSVIENIFSDGLDEGTQMSFTYGNYYLITEGDDFEITALISIQSQLRLLFQIQRLKALLFQAP